MQYPHTLIITNNDPAARDEDGNPAKGAPSDIQYKCRFEISKDNAFLSGTGGDQIAYSGIVYMDHPGEVIRLGAEVKVMHGAKVKAKGKVLQYSEGQFNARIWL